MLLEVRSETKGHFLVGTVILGFLSIITKSQASSTYEALKSARPSKCQRDVRHPVQMRWRPRVSTGDSDIPSSCKKKDETAFKILKGIPAFQVSVSRRPFHLRQKTQGPFHIPIPEGKLL